MRSENKVCLSPVANENDAGEKERETGDTDKKMKLLHLEKMLRNLRILVKTQHR